MNLDELNSKINLSVGKYSFYQCVRTLMAHLENKYPNEGFELLYKRLRFKANPSLSFAKSEISKIEFLQTRKGLQVELTVNFLSLSGSSSPLPSHYAEMVLNNHGENQVLSDFFNFFNHHLQKMVYLIWEKQRYFVQYSDTMEDKFSSYLLSLLGLYSQEQIKNSKINIKKLMPYIGLLSMKQKSTSSLTAILRHYLEHDAIEVVEFITMSTIIPAWQRVSLGVEKCSLSSDAMLGESIKTKSSKFQILLKNISWDGLFEYSVLGKKMSECRELIHLALSNPLEYELCLWIKKDEIQPVSLSSEYLGVNSFLGLPDDDRRIIVNN